MREPVKSLGSGPEAWGAESKCHGDSLRGVPNGRKKLTKKNTLQQEGGEHGRRCRSLTPEVGGGRN